MQIKIRIIERPLVGTILGEKLDMPSEKRVNSPDVVQINAVAKKLNIPWNMEFSPKNRIILTERPGPLNILNLDNRSINKLFEPPAHFIGRRETDRILAPS